MDDKCQKELAMVVEGLEGISKTLAGVREAMEQVGESTLVDDYFHILISLEGVNEARDRLMEISEKRRGRKCGLQNAPMPGRG